MKAKCPNCNSTFTCDRNEDGQPEIPDVQKCAVEWCEVYLCPKDCQHLSFVCFGCGQRVCQMHPSLQMSGEIYCIMCMPDIVANTPEEPFDLPEVA